MTNEAMTKNDALLPCPFCGEQPQVNQFGGVVHDLDNEKAANCWLSCTSTENISEWQTRPTPAPLSNGDALDKAPFIWVTIQSNGQPKIGTIEYGENQKYYSEETVASLLEALTPSPVAVDAKAGDAAKLRYYLEEGLKYKPLPTKEKRPVSPACVLASYIQDALNELNRIEALTAPNPDSKE